MLPLNWVMTSITLQSPTFKLYDRLLHLSELIKIELADLKPKKHLDTQSFLYVIGSAEYERLSAED